MEDEALRAALHAARDAMCALDSSSKKRDLRQLIRILESLPVQIGFDDAAGVLGEYARACAPLKGDDPRGQKANALRALSIIFDCMAALGCQSSDGCVLWIRGNAGLLGGRGKSRRTVIKRVISSKLGPASCRMLEIPSEDLPQLLVFDIDNLAIQDLMIEAAAPHTAGPGEVPLRGLRKLASTFAESMAGDVPECPDGFRERHLAAQMEYYGDDKDSLWLLVRIYLRIAVLQGSRSPLATEGITAEFLASHMFVSRYRAGYRAVSYSPLDPVPAWDRWLLFPNGAEGDYAAGKPDKGHRVDFSEIDEPLRSFAKRWFWTGDGSLQTRIGRLCQTRYFLRWRKEVSTFVDLDDPYLVHSEDLELYLSHLRSRYARTSFKEAKSGLRAFVEFLSEEGSGLADPLCAYVIGEFGEGEGGSERDKSAMSKEHYSRIEEELRHRAETSSGWLQQYTAFLLMGCMPVRESSALDLKLSHVVEASRPGLYVLRQPSKTTGRSKRDYQLPARVKAAIDRCARDTQPLRDEAPAELRDYVFLVPVSKGGVSVMVKGTFDDRLGRLCAELGLPPYSASSIRRRYMTDADDAADELGMGASAKRAVTGHVDPTVDPRHYIRRDDADYYEALYGVEIGAAKIKGEVLAEKPGGLDEGELVEKGSGWCGCEACMKGIASCLICSGFRTTPSQIPAFKANIARIESMMAEAGTDHDRGHLAAYKALNVAYICALEALREEL